MPSEKSYVKFFRCKHCDRVYNTEKEARACVRPEALKLKRDELILYRGCVYSVIHVGDWDLNLQYIRDWDILEGCELRTRRGAVCYLKKGMYCNGVIKKLTRADIEKHLKRRRKQVAAGERLLEKLKCMK